jgi:N-acetylglucosamine-6-phosphate deacetylase
MEIYARNLLTQEPEHIVVNNGVLSLDSDRFSGRDFPSSTNQQNFVSVPGLVDLQVNGYGGRDYSSTSLSPDDVARVCEQMLTIGTLYHLPTIITRPQDIILRNLKTLEAARNREPTINACILGYHIEGPYISEIDGPRGAHDADYIRNPDIGEYREWQAASNNRLRIVTIAPERPGSIAFIERLVEDGVVAAIGHSAASPDEIRTAVAAGASMSTHLGNGSHRTIPRLHNYIWEQLAADNLTAGVIADGFHLPDAVIKTIGRTKELHRIVLVSDLSPMAGLSPGSYTWDKVEIEVAQDGSIQVGGSPFFAGAWRSLASAVPVFMRAAGASLADTVALATTAPARLIGLGSWYHKLSTGDSVTVFTIEGESLSTRPILSAIGGRVVHQAPS